MSGTCTRQHLRNGRYGRALVVSLVIVASIFLLGIAATEYSAFWKILVGVGLCFAIMVIARIPRGMWASLIKASIVPGCVIAAMVLLVLPGSLRVRSPTHHARSRPLLYVATYQVRLEPMDQSLDRFSVREQVVLSPDSAKKYIPEGKPPVLELAPHEARSTARGFLFREVALRAPKVADSRYVVETEPNGSTDSTFMLAYTGAEADVEVRRLPTGCFYSASGGSKPERRPYFHEETISWRLSDPGQGVAFAYIRRPFQALRPILVPFIQLGGMSSCLVAVSFLFTSGFVALVVKPVLADQAKAFLKRLLGIRDKPAQ